MLKKKKTRVYLIISAIVILLFLVVARKNGWIGKDNKIMVSTEEIEKRTIEETVTANGKIQPEVEVIINPDASGEIMEILVKEGDQVKKGEMLARINPDIYKSAVDRMRASLNTQKANLANAKARLAQVRAQYITAENNFKRNKKLYKEKVISDAEYETAESQFEVAKAEVEAAKQSVLASEYGVESGKAALKEAEDNLTKTSVFAPMDGTISKLSKEEGERVSGASQFSAGTEIMRVAKLNTMEVIVEVSENDIVRVSKDDTAVIEVDAYNDREFTGIVTEIANSAVTSGFDIDQVTNFEVKIRILPESYSDLLDSSNSHLSPFRPGMSANVDIKTHKAEDVIAVPIQSVTTRTDTSSGSKLDQVKRRLEEEKEKKEGTLDDDKIREYVFIYKSGKVKIVEVETGIQDNTFIEIVKGLEEGLEVVSAPYSAINKDLENGKEVKKVKKEQLFEEK
jgi:HlyD family secretion protein